MAFDYNDIQETIVVEGVGGKVIMIYGSNNVGKSKTSTQYPKPITLPLEPNALNAIGNAQKLPVHDWATFRDFVESVYKDKVNYEKFLSNLERHKTKVIPKDKEKKKEYEEKLIKLEKGVAESPCAKLKERVKTINMDSLTALAKSAEKYVTDEAEVLDLGDGNRGKLYKRFENEVYHTINKFFNLGDFTYIILAHEDFRNIGTEDEPIMQAIPKGDWKRVVKPVIDRCDIIVYLKSNGVDENYKVINSSAILGECDLCFARSKWDNMQLYIEDYSAQSLTKVINDEIGEQKEAGVATGTMHEQQQSLIESLTYDHEVLIEQIGELVTKIYTFDDEDIDGVNMVKYQTIVEEYLGLGKSVSECNDKYVGQLKNILSRTQDLADELV